MGSSNFWICLGFHVALGCGLFFGCAADGAGRSPVSAPPVVTVADEEESWAREPVLTDAAWGWLEAPSFSARVRVPDSSGWRVLESGRWFVARHEATGTTLSIRLWNARRTVTREECERELWLGRADLRELDAAEVVDDQLTGGPAGFDTRIRLWTQRDTGAAVATGAGHRRCYAGIFRTRAGQPELTLRLQLAADGILSQVELQSVEDLRQPSRIQRPF